MVRMRRLGVGLALPLLTLAVWHNVVSFKSDQFVSSNTVSIKDAKECKATTYSSVSRRTPTFEFPNNQYLWKVGFHNTSERAVCDFVDFQYSKHFPHALQFLLRCVSFWNEHSDKEWFLRFTRQGPHPRLKRVPKFSKIKRMAKGRRKTIYFLDGFILDLEKLGATLTYETEPFVSEQEEKDVIPIEPPYLMRSPDDAKTLAAQIQKLHSIPQRPTCQTTQPVVGVLNRAISSKRSLLNVDEIVGALEYAGYSVKATQFEGVPYRSQVEFFSSIDVLLSPHGAQNTGLFVMPLCGGVLEVFPDSYFIPDFYGSLAETSGISHYAMLLSNNSDVAPNPHYRSRSVQFCPNVDDVVEAVDGMVDDWRMCCSNATAAGN